ncbi:nascent polypeptide-associated complex subunit alpha, muscle-specific form-like isoform X2 [Homo sapiens]|uniref:nascent polypeptide-associated complex subunit alpha, muscle-specific form-like isoform X2 n=1 Tax=Homo sapiens TaxID=9606 RepID=UPI001FB17C4B|nr:nascent polypeptide-associated complex subunit alpha, muscle-specific form-like isoform X2 [Homo sapiens]
MGSSKGLRRGVRASSAKAVSLGGGPVRVAGKRTNGAHPQVPIEGPLQRRFKEPSPRVGGLGPAPGGQRRPQAWRTGWSGWRALQGEWEETGKPGRGSAGRRQGCVGQGGLHSLASSWPGWAPSSSLGQLRRRPREESPCSGPRDLLPSLESLSWPRCRDTLPSLAGGLVSAGRGGNVGQRFQVWPGARGSGRKNTQRGLPGRGLTSQPAVPTPQPAEASPHSRRLQRHSRRLQPRSRRLQPRSRRLQPRSRRLQPRSRRPHLTAGGSNPAAGGSNPAAGGSNPAAGGLTSQPAAPTPQPAAPTPQPAAPTPQPAASPHSRRFQPHSRRFQPRSRRLQPRSRRFQPRSRRLQPRSRRLRAQDHREGAPGSSSSWALPPPPSSGDGPRLVPMTQCPTPASPAVPGRVPLVCGRPRRNHFALPHPLLPQATGPAPWPVGGRISLVALAPCASGVPHRPASFQHPP